MKFLFRVREHSIRSNCYIQSLFFNTLTARSTEKNFSNAEYIDRGLHRLGYSDIVIVRPSLLSQVKVTHHHNLFSLKLNFVDMPRESSCKIKYSSSLNQPVYPSVESFITRTLTSKVPFNQNMICSIIYSIASLGSWFSAGSIRFKGKAQNMHLTSLS